ncbi:MAG: hypothetical protein HKP12_01680 [Gammaproteobacteria bacterium]|nr:hypothetical protein [Gammaproteobacteria bacterium]
MPAIHPVPDKNDLLQILSMLYGDALTLDTGTAVASDAGSKSVVAIYVNDDNVPVTACICDYGFVAYAGSALTRIPPAGAEDAAESGDFSDMMLGNHHEVMNICSRLFMKGKSPHIRLDKVYASPDELPEAAQSVIESDAGCAHFEIEVPGYGKGSVSFLST